jgi:hypothetical protein
MLALLIAGAGLFLLIRDAFHEPEIDPSVLQAIELDPGFLASPPAAQDVNSGRQTACRDDSGDPPQTFRALQVPQADERVVEFFRLRLVGEGWVLNDSVPIPGGAAFSKSLNGHPMDLRIYTSPEHNRVTLSAQTPC